jgi:integrase
MGNVRCSKCGHRRERPGTCPKCGAYRCYISIFWRGKPWKIWRFTDGHLLDYDHAQALLGNVRVNLAAGAFDPSDYSKERMEEMLLANKVEEWLAVKEKERDQDIIRPSSFVSMSGHVAHHIIPGLGRLDVRHITKEDLEAFRNGLPGSLKNKTRKNIFVTLHSFFAWLVDHEIRPMPPFPDLAGNSDAVERRALDREEQDTGLARIPEGVLRDMIEFGMETGIRPGELVVLKVGDINIKSAIGTISRTVSAASYILEGTKGRSFKGKSRKKRRMLLSIRACEIAASYTAGRFGNEYLFICPFTGRRYSVNAPNKAWRKYSGVDVCYYEASRHSLATQLAGEMDAYDLQLIMGWSDIRTPQGYVHRRLEGLRDKINSRGKVVEISSISGGSK